MKKAEVIVIHEFNGPKYLEALIKLQADGKVGSIRFLEASVIKKFIKDIFILKKPIVFATRRAIENLVFRFQVPFLKEKIVVLGIPPWDFRMIWYGRLARSNRFIYNTSWFNWHPDNVPRRYGFLSRFFRAVWSQVFATPNLQVVCVTSTSMDGIQKEFPKLSVRAIPHVVSDVFFNMEPPNFEQKFKILYVGELLPKKGIKLLPEILDRLSDLPVQLGIVGDGSLRGFVEELKSCPNVTVYGKISDRKALAQLYAQHHVLLVPSLKTEKWEELFGMVLIEAMAVGLPVIVSDHVGPRSIVHHGRDGFLVPNGAIEIYAKQIRLLATNPNKWQELSTHARVTAQDYTLAAVSKQWLELLQQVSNQ